MREERKKGIREKKNMSIRRTEERCASSQETGIWKGREAEEAGDEGKRETREAFTDVREREREKGQQQQRHPWQAATLERLTLARGSLSLCSLARLLSLACARLLLRESKGRDPPASAS